MKTADIQKAPLGTEFAVTTGRYSTKNMNTTNLNRNHCEKVTLVNLNKYTETSRSSNSPTDSWFTIASAGSRDYGFLVTDGSTYWVAKPAKFLDTYADADAVWSKREAQHKAMQEVYNRRDEAEQAVLPQAQREVTVQSETILSAIERLAGADARTSAWVSARAVAQWSLDAQGQENLKVVSSGDVRLPFTAMVRILQRIADLEAELA